MLRIDSIAPAPNGMIEITYSMSTGNNWTFLTLAEDTRILELPGILEAHWKLVEAQDDYEDDFKD